MNDNTLVVVGSLFGDEGKAKIVDYISKKFDYIVRYQGGDNAGHSVVVGDEKFVFQLIPSGIFQSSAVIANGVVINPENLLAEIEKLEPKFNVKSRLFVSNNAHIVFDWNVALDTLIENIRDSKVGTTGRGIGPTYAYKSLRLGARAIDLLDKDNLKKIINNALMFCNPLFEKYKMPIFDLEKSVEKYYEIGQKITPYLIDTTVMLNAAIEHGKRILFEGGQGLFLDLDFGTYPFVTSSSVVGSLISGTGLSCDKFKAILGVVKAYTTRVGNGAFVTEIKDEELASKIRNIGSEFGSVTGRSRRIGWMDLYAIKYGVKFSGINSIALTLVDVLNGFSEVKVCIGYEGKDETDKWEYHEKLKPIYKTFKGWKDDYSKIQDFEDFSAEFKSFVRFIERYLGVEVRIISYGKQRNEILML